MQRNSLVSERGDDGQIYFRPEVLDAAPKRGNRPPQTVSCTKCGRPFKKPAHRVDRTVRHFCTRCSGAGPIGRRDSEETRGRKSAAVSARWRNGELEQTRESMRERGKSWARKAKWPRSRGEAVEFVDRIDKMTRKRYGHSLDEERRRALIDAALERAKPHYKRGRKPSGIAAELQRIAGDVIAGHIEAEDLLELSQAELLAEIGLVAWQEGIGSFRADFPGATPLADGYAREWRRNVVERVRRHVGDHVAGILKSLQIATT